MEKIKAFVLSDNYNRRKDFPDEVDEWCTQNQPISIKNITTEKLGNAYVVILITYIDHRPIPLVEESNN